MRRSMVSFHYLTSCYLCTGQYYRNQRKPFRVVGLLMTFLLGPCYCPHFIWTTKVEYHDILWDIGYAKTWEEASEKIGNLYQERPPLEDFLIWRDLRVMVRLLFWCRSCLEGTFILNLLSNVPQYHDMLIQDEVHWYGWVPQFTLRHDEEGLYWLRFTSCIHEFPNHFTLFETDNYTHILTIKCLSSQW